ncbi:MAG: NAD(P)H-dependent oxidoreductase [Acidimicrobiia bacterium]|nr:NAD(P)H-dependent oxidoreductase [Acidimicrobiia bacterium]
MRVLAFAASNSSRSINGQLVAHATHLLEDGLIGDVTVETIDLNDFEMPIYSSDRENDTGIPEAAQSFFAKIGSADALLISFAEHNGSYTAAYKNVFDWASRIDARVYQDKPAVLLSASPGPGGASTVLDAAVTSGPFFGYDVTASLSIPSFYDNFDLEAGVLTNTEIDTQFRKALTSLDPRDETR